MVEISQAARILVKVSLRINGEPEEISGRLSIQLRFSEGVKIARKLKPLMKPLHPLSDLNFTRKYL